MRITSLIQRDISGVIFLLRNIFRAKDIGQFQPVSIDGVNYRPYHKMDVNQVAILYSKLNNGARFSGFRRWMYDLLGERLLLIATINDENYGQVVVALNMYYFNFRDIRERTVHEGFIGVAPEMEGKGVATTMRKLAKENFIKYKLLGISTRISVNNKASLASALKLGFLSVEKYCDPQSNEDRYYMVCKF